jgi:hypothetical protein
MKTTSRHGSAGRALGAFMFLSTLLFAAPAASVPITVTFRDTVLAGGSTTTPPTTIDNVTRNVFLRFNVPDFHRIVSLNSIDVTVVLHDDLTDPSGSPDEAANILFAVRAPGIDVFLDFAGPADLEGTTSGSPFVLTTSVSPLDFPDILPTLTDNAAFRIRVNRCCGDFVVVGGSVAIDAELSALPAPGTLACVSIGLAGLAWTRRRRPGR